MGRNPKWMHLVYMVYWLWLRPQETSQVCALHWCLERFESTAVFWSCRAVLPQHRGHLSNIPARPPSPSKAGVGRTLGRVTARKYAPSWPKGHSIPFSICSDIKAKRGERRRTNIITIFASQRNHYLCWNPASWALSAHGNQRIKKIFCISFLPYPAFSLSC